LFFLVVEAITQKKKPGTGRAFKGTWKPVFKGTEETTFAQGGATWVGTFLQRITGM